MKRLELKKPSKVDRVAKRKSLGSSIKRRVSVSEAKAHLSAVLKQAQGGQSIIVTDHGKDIALIEGIRETGQLHLIPAQRPFSEVRRVRAPEAGSSPQPKSILALND